MNKKLTEQINQKLEIGEYREAVEIILEEMKTLSDDFNDNEMFNSIEVLLTKTFNLTNIDWKKAATEQKWEVRNS